MAEGDLLSWVLEFFCFVLGQDITQRIWQTKFLKPKIRPQQNDLKNYINYLEKPPEELELFCRKKNNLSMELTENSLSLPP